MERLAGDEGEDALDYIISVDIFSEGWEFLGDKIEPEVVCRIFLMFGLMKVGSSL